MRTALLFLLLLVPALAAPPSVAPGMYRPFDPEETGRRYKFDLKMPQIFGEKTFLEVPVNRRLEPVVRGGPAALILEPDPNAGGRQKPYGVLLYKPGPVPGLAYFRFGLLSPDLEKSIRAVRQIQRTWNPDGPSGAFISQALLDRWSALPAVPASEPDAVKSLLRDFYRHLIAHPELNESYILQFVDKRGLNPLTLKAAAQEVNVKDDAEITRLRAEWQRLHR